VLPAKTSTPTGQPSALHSKAIPHLFVTPLAVAIIAEGDDVALGVGSFKVAAAMEPAVKAPDASFSRGESGLRVKEERTRVRGA
jgi:hypothetical protein